MKSFEKGKKYSVIITVTQSGKTLIADTITENPISYVHLALNERGPGFYGISIMEVRDDKLIATVDRFIEEDEKDD